MRHQRLFTAALAVLAALALGAARPVRAQDPNLTARLLAAINGYRVENGLPPYAYSPLLSVSAQRHSEYQASIGGWTHYGPDGSLTLQRALAVGYPARRANENVYAGGTNPEQVAYWWYTADQDHRNNVLHPVLREIGIGIAPDAEGQLYWTMDISAQPNVLPIFINNDAYATGVANVTLVLWNEGVFYGEGQLGTATQVMISNSPDFSGASQQGWAQNIPWTLDTSGGIGLKTVYVRFIDGYGRTADSQDSIMYDGTAINSAPALPPIATLPTLAPAQPAVAQPQPQAPSQPEPQPTATPTSDPTQVAEIVAPPSQPTIDYSIFRQEPSASAFSGQPAGPAPILGVSVTRWRDIFVGTLALGIGMIALGLLALIRSWKKYRLATVLTPKEETSHGND